MTAIINAELVMRTTEIPEGCEIIDAEGAFVGPGLEHVTDLNFTYRASGGIDISGSKLTLNVACRNYMKHTGASIVDAFKVASYNPAKAVGLTDRGEIREGLRADLIFVDIKMNVKTVILGGKVVREN